MLFSPFMAVQPDGDVVTEILLTGETIGIGVYADPATAPKLTRSFGSTVLPLQSEGIAAAPQAKGTWVFTDHFARFAATAMGSSASPVQTIEPNQGHFREQFAVDRRYLYAVDSASSSLDVFRTNRSGKQAPFATVPVQPGSTNIVGVAAGP
jgi:hypothetical protein